MQTAIRLRGAGLALSVVLMSGCAPRVAAPAAAPAASVAADAREPRPASDAELARYAERQEQARDLAGFRGGQRIQATTVIIILLVVILLVILI